MAREPGRLEILRKALRGKATELTH
jgi:hypothetical protein